MKVRNLRGILLLAVGLVFLAGNCFAMHVMTKEKLKELLGKPGVYIIDIRTPQQWGYTTNKIPGAVHEEKGQFATWSKKYPKDATIVVYCNCDNESTSGAVAEAFEAEGYKNVYALKGGWMPWIMSKYPVEPKDAPGGVKPAGAAQ